MQQFINTRQAERLLRREPDKLPSHHLAELDRLLERHQPLARLQAMRAELRAVWESTTASEQEALALLAFVRTLRAYR